MCWHQSPRLPCTCAIRSAVWVRDVDVKDIKKLEAFHLRCQRQLLCASWRDHITNAAICKQTKLTSLTELISRRRTSLFGHIARLDAAVPAHQALWLQTNISTGRNPGTSWKRLSGRPRKTWILSDSRWYWNVIARLLGCLHSSWPWKRDATVSEDYALMMMMMISAHTRPFSAIHGVYEGDYR